MALASGASRAATGSISANADSVLALESPSSQVLISNNAAAACYVRINGAVSTTVYDAILAAGDRMWVEEVVVETVHVYVNATSGVRVVYW